MATLQRTTWERERERRKCVVYTCVDGSCTIIRRGNMSSSLKSYVEKYLLNPGASFNVDDEGNQGECVYLCVFKWEILWPALMFVICNCSYLVVFPQDYIFSPLLNLYHSRPPNMPSSLTDSITLLSHFTSTLSSIYSHIFLEYALLPPTLPISSVSHDTTTFFVLPHYFLYSTLTATASLH